MQNAKRRMQNQNPSHLCRWLAVSFCMVHFAFCVCFADDNLPPPLDLAVARGLDFLARQQQPDGSFAAFDEPEPRSAPAALAVIAFLSAGQSPLAGKHAATIHSAVEFLLRQLPEDGYFGRADGSGMAGQAAITIALAEVYGCENDAMIRQQIRPQLQNSLEAILKLQDGRTGPRAGGWAGDGQGGEGDLPTTASMVLALRALRDAGIKVPKETFDSAAAFVRSCAAADQPLFAEKGARPTTMSVAAAVATLLLAEAATPADLPDAIKFLSERRVGEGRADYYMAVYWDAMAAMLAGDPTWTAAWRPARDALLSPQRRTEDGSWIPQRAPGIRQSSVQSTATVVMTLAMPYRLLPLYGRLADDKVKK